MRVSSKRSVSSTSFVVRRRSKKPFGAFVWTTG